MVCDLGDVLKNLRSYERLLEQQTGKAVRPFRRDGYVNVLNRYGTEKDTTERYEFRQEPPVPDDFLASYYEGNGLFAKIIDAPAEEAIKHGFSLGLADTKIEDFYTSALDELDWEETAMTAIKWARLFGGSIIVMLINDGRGLDEPLDWANIKSIDDLRVYDRSVIQEDMAGMFTYNPADPFRTRASRLGMPEYYNVFSKYGTFRVHDSRCLVFQNGILPENTTNSTYQLWGVPEYIRINRAIRDTEVAHGSAVKLLDRSVQAVYKMTNLAAELATEEGEARVLRRLQAIDMARGLLNSITIDADGEDYDFKTFQFAGVSDVIDSTCNLLSALTNIPQTILFGRSPSGMNSTGEADLENWYGYIERIQSRAVRKNLRYLLSVIFQAGVATGEVDKVPPLNIKFNSLWSMSENEQATLEQTKANTQQIKANTAKLYMDAQVLDPTEVRRKLAQSDEFDVETVLDDEDLGDEDLFRDVPSDDEIPALADILGGTAAGSIEGGTSPDAAPAATKLPQDMTQEELGQLSAVAEDSDDTEEVRDESRSVAVLVASDGCLLTGYRKSGFCRGLVCGPGGHLKEGETPEEAAIRETQEEFGITPKDLLLIGTGPFEPDTGLKPLIYLATEYEGEPKNMDGEMADVRFRSLAELNEMHKLLFQPFSDSLEMLMLVLGKGDLS